MPFDRQRLLVFLHIPKTAGTSVEQALDLYGPWHQENLETGFGLIQNRDLLARNLSSNFLQHLTLRELETLFPEVLNNATIFTVVRDPWQRFLSSFRNPDPDLANFYRYRTSRELDQLSLAEYIDVARWLPHPHLRPQLDFVRGERGHGPDARVQVFRQDDLASLETWLSAYCGTGIRLPRSNPSRRPLPDLSEESVRSLEQQVRWLYAVDGHAFGYNSPHSHSAPLR